MIDTDKYEGHTEAPWELTEREGTGLFNLVMWRREEKKPIAYAYNSGKYTYEYPNAQLIADAPLILAAYDKQVRWINDILFRLEKMEEASASQRLRFLLTVQEELEMMIE